VRGLNNKRREIMKATIRNDYDYVSRANALRQAHRWGDRELIDNLKKDKSLTIVFFCNDESRRIEWQITSENDNPANIDVWNAL
jgi:hypothetical protein